MTLKKSLVAGSAIAAVFGLTLVALSAAPMADSAAGPGAAGVPAMMGAVHHAHFRGGADDHRGRFGRACGRHGSARLERMTGIVEGLMAFTPDQQQAWDGLKSALNAGKASLEETCQSFEDADAAKSAPERLSRWEKMMSTRLSVLQSVRPVFDTFYATLNEKQQQAIDGLFHRGPRGHRGGGGHRR